MGIFPNRLLMSKNHLDSLYAIAYNSYMKQVLYYTTSDGKSPYFDWYNKLDNSIKQKIDIRINRLKNGSYGDFKRISNYLIELRFKLGSGYRIYCTEAENIIILILCAGDKSTQAKDIEKAKLIIKEIRS